jgi:hypothetical protein
VWSVYYHGFHFWHYVFRYSDYVQNKSVLIRLVYRLLNTKRNTKTNTRKIRYFCSSNNWKNRLKISPRCVFLSFEFNFGVLLNYHTILLQSTIRRDNMYGRTIMAPPTLFRNAVYCLSEWYIYMLCSAVTNSLWKMMI